MNADGSLIPEFNSSNIFTTDYKVYSFDITQNNKLIIDGYNYITQDGFLYRIDENGDIDNTFNTISNLQHIRLYVNKIIGEKLAFGGISYEGGSLDRVVPLFLSNHDGGNIDEMSVGISNSDGYAHFNDILTLNDTEFIIGGLFDKVNGFEKGGLAKVQLNGAVDQEFDFNVNGSVSKIIKEGNDTILVFGQFNMVNDVPMFGAVRIYLKNKIPTITGTTSDLSTTENTAFELSFTDIVVSDIDDNYPEGFTININDGSNYTVNNSQIVPDDGFLGELIVPITVNDGTDDSPLYDLAIEVTADVTGINLTGSSSDIRIFPNPASDYLSLKIENNVFGSVSVKILSLNGAILESKIFEKKVNVFQKSISLHDYSSGVYLIQIKLNDKLQFVERIIVE